METEMNSLALAEKSLHIGVALLIGVLLLLAGVPMLLAAAAIVLFLGIRAFESADMFKRSRRDRDSPERRLLSAGAIGSLIGGIIIGGLIGFLLRPSAPLIGQLSFEHVITRGSSLQGVDLMLVRMAETAFNYLLTGAIVGGVIGVGWAFVLSKRKEGLSMP
jgi:hypothetical protein